MNHLKAQIIDIESVDTLNRLTFDFFGQKLYMFSLELDESIRVNSTVILGIKATNIAIAKRRYLDLTISNQLDATIKSIRHGRLLSSIDVVLDHTTLESIITKESALRLDLKVGDEVTLLIKASSLYIVEVLDV